MFQRWRLIFRYLPPYRRILGFGIGALVLGNLCQLVAPLFMRDAMRAIEIPYGAGEPVLYGAVASSASIALVITLAAGVLFFFKRYLIVGVSRRVEADLRRDLFRHIQRLPMRFFHRTRTGDLMSRATSDLDSARMAIGPAIMYLVDSLLRFTGALIIMLSVDAEITLYALMPLLGIGAGLFFFAPRIQRAARAVQDQLAAISARSQESFAGGRVVKTFATEDRERAELDALGRDYLEANVNLSRIRGLTTSWVVGMGAMAMVLILWVGGQRVLAGEFDIASLLLFNSYQVMLIWPMMAFGWVLAMVQRGAAGVDRIAEVLDCEIESEGAVDASLEGAIEFKKLDFSYDEGRPVLRDVSVAVPAGTTLGIVGPTGSGKSTFASLLPRLYDPPRGTVFLDRIDVLDLPLAALRRAVAVVPQEAFLFSATIGENVAFGRPDIDPAELDAAVHDAHLVHDVDALPDGLDTRVGERGVTLSGGQKQRAALARAIAANARVLVLDDALSAVDTQTEATILENLRRVRRGRTVVLIAHRVSALREADRILYVKNGAIVESGTHEELLARDGEYARLARTQALEAEIEAMQ
ncbi:MAG: ABC transporter ATP-binding protein/permease [Planctomycetota bacterium]|nr:ABC transporter ATP-binding protein/permease [Planctomycetota bacterium]